MSRRTSLLLSAAVLLCLLLPSPTTWAAPVPSQDRQADLAAVQDVVARAEVSRALQASGLTAEQIDSRLAQLSDADLAALAADLDQVQAGGRMDRDTMWIIVYILAGILLIVLLV